MVNKQLLL